MSDCPSCHQAVEILEKHKGTLFNCPHCNAVFFVDWNGQPELAQHEAEPAFESAPPHADFSSAPTEFSSVESSSGSEAIPTYSESAHDFSSNDYSSSGPGLASNDPSAEYSSSGAALSSVPEPHENFPDEKVLDPYGADQTLGQVPEQPGFSGTPDTSDFSDVTDFANAATSTGPLSYVVIIDGIDSSHLVRQLREAMMDARFAWDVEELLTHISAARLVLNGLSPAKASVLINRIKYLPLKISWRQDVLFGS